MSEEIKYCMNFTNEEIIKFLVNPLKKYTQLDIRFLSDDDRELLENTTEKIEHVILDGDKQEFYLCFYDDLINLYTPHEKFMFFDDRVSKDFKEGSDLYGEIFYEGILSNKTHKEILELLLQFVEILIGTTKVEVIEVKTTDKKDKDLINIVDFVIKIFNETGEKKQITIENITFIVNGD